jgi:hypothetical protein
MWSLADNNDKKDHIADQSSQGNQSSKIPNHKQSLLFPAESNTSKQPKA